MWQCSLKANNCVHFYWRFLEWHFLQNKWTAEEWNVEVAFEVIRLPEFIMGSV